MEPYSSEQNFESVLRDNSVSLLLTTTVLFSDVVRAESGLIYCHLFHDHSGVDSLRAGRRSFEIFATILKADSTIGCTVTPQLHVFGCIRRCSCIFSIFVTFAAGVHDVLRKDDLTQTREVEYFERVLLRSEKIRDVSVRVEGIYPR